MALKIKLKRNAGTPTTSNLEDGEIAHNTSANTLHVRIGDTIHTVGGTGGGGGGGSIDLSAVDQDIIPDGNGTRNLGSASKRFGDLFLSGDTLNLGGATISSDGTVITIPNDSKDADGNKIAISDTEGTPVRKVPVFTASGGLSSAAVTLTMKASASRTRVFNGLTLANGDSLSATQQTQLFEF